MATLTEQLDAAKQASQTGTPSGSGGVFRTVDDFVRAIAQGATFGHADEFAAFMRSKTENVPYDEALKQERTRDASTSPWMRFGGNLVGGAMSGAAAAPAFGLGAGAQGLGLGQTIARGTALGATEGGLHGFGSAQGGLQRRLGAGLKGAAIGAPIGAVGGALQQWLRPSADVRALQARGVNPTIGQAVGGALKRTEDKLTSIPLLGDIIAYGQRRAIKDFNRVALDDSLGEIGHRLPKRMPVGRNALQWAYKKIGRAYDDALDQIDNAQTDPKFVDDLAELTGLSQHMVPERAKQFAKIMDDVIARRIEPSGQISARSLKDAEHTLGDLATRFVHNADPDQHGLGIALLETQAALRRLVERSNPAAANLLSRANRAYAKFLRPLTAASGPGAKEGVFSPAQLQSAVRRLDPSKGKRRFAMGTAPGQALSEAGENVLGANFPTSGTTERALTAGLALGAPAGYAAGSGFISPGMAGALLSPGLLYTPWGSRAAVGALTNPSTVPAVQGGILAPWIQGQQR